MAAEKECAKSVRHDNQVTTQTDWMPYQIVNYHIEIDSSNRQVLINMRGNRVDELIRTAFFVFH